MVAVGEKNLLLLPASVWKFGSPWHFHLCSCFGTTASCKWFIWPCWHCSLGTSHGGKKIHCLGPGQTFWSHVAFNQKHPQKVIFCVNVTLSETANGSHTGLIGFSKGNHGCSCHGGWPQIVLLTSMPCWNPRNQWTRLWTSWWLSSKNMGWLITKLVWHHPKFCATPTTEPSRWFHGWTCGPKASRCWPLEWKGSCLGKAWPWSWALTQPRGNSTSMPTRPSSRRQQAPWHLCLAKNVSRHTSKQFLFFQPRDKPFPLNLHLLFFPCATEVTSASLLPTQLHFWEPSSMVAYQNKGKPLKFQGMIQHGTSSRMAGNG